MGAELDMWFSPYNAYYNMKQNGTTGVWIHRPLSMLDPPKRVNARS